MKLKRNKILLVSSRLFGQCGYYNTSIQNIADASGTSQTNVLYHFKSKMILFEEVVKKIIQENSKIIEHLHNTADNPATKLLKHFKGNYLWAVEYDFNATIMTSIYHFATIESSFTNLYSVILTAARSKIKEYLLLGVQDKSFILSCNNIDMVAEELHDFLLGSILNIVSSNLKSNLYNFNEKKWKEIITLFTQYKWH